MAVRLDCPICGARIVDGPPPRPGACPSCGARYAGDGESAPAAVAAALTAFDLTDLDAAAVTAALFALEPGAGPRVGAAITSDARDDDFYRWWLFARDAGDGGPRAVLAALL